MLSAKTHETNSPTLIQPAPAVGNCSPGDVTEVGANLRHAFIAEQFEQWCRDLVAIEETDGCFFDVAGSVVRKRMGW